MEPIRVELQIKNAKYFSLLDEYNERFRQAYNERYRQDVELDIHYHTTLQNSLKAQFEQELLESGIPNSEIISEECEMVYVNYDAFNCVLLHDDGTYTQHSLSEIKQIR